MTAAFRAFSTDNIQSGDTLTLPKPTGAVDNDILLAGIYSDLGNITTVPTGWVLVPDCDISTAAAPGVDGNVYRKVASSEGASWDWTFSASPTRALGVVLAYSGGNTTTPIDASLGSEDSGGNTVVAPSITTTEDNVIVVCFFMSNWDQNTWTPPASTTDRVDTQPNLGNHNGTMGVVDFVQVTAGATPTRTGTTSGDNDAGIGFQIALKNAAAGTNPKGPLDNPFSGPFGGPV